MEINPIISAGRQVAKIKLGRCGMLSAGRQQFDISEWVERYGADGVVEIRHIRKGDSKPYQASEVTVADGIVTWTFDETDTASPGYGVVTLIYKKYGKYTVKTAPYITYTEPTADEIFNASGGSGGGGGGEDVPIADDAEIDDMLDNVFGDDARPGDPSSGGEPADPGTTPEPDDDNIATDEEIKDLFDGIFGS